MVVPAEKPLVDLTEKELIGLLRTLTEPGRYLTFSYNDIRFELERKRTETWARRGYWLSIIAILFSVVSLVIGLLSR